MERTCSSYHRRGTQAAGSRLLDVKLCQSSESTFRAYTTSWTVSRSLLAKSRRIFEKETWKITSFNNCRATLYASTVKCCRRVSVRLSVRHKPALCHVGGSRKQCPTIAEFSFFCCQDLGEIPTWSPQVGRQIEVGQVTIDDFRPISRHRPIFKTLLDKDIVTMEC